MRSTQQGTQQKNRTQYLTSYYQKNQEKLRRKRRERWLIQQKEKKNQEKEQASKYYGAEAIRIYLSLKEFTELSQAKMKLYLDFIWTLKKSSRIGISNIIEVMHIRELAENLISDYWLTAKQEKRARVRKWNNLSEEEQQRLIKHWGLEKARKERGLINELEELEKQGETHEKEIEITKYHEERGKINCECWQCELTNKGKREKRGKKCSGCDKRVRKLDEEHEICKECVEKYES